jgi:hypothetical protein
MYTETVMDGFLNNYPRFPRISKQIARALIITIFFRKLNAFGE